MQSTRDEDFERSEFSGTRWIRRSPQEVIRPRLWSRIHGILEYSGRRAAAKRWFDSNMGGSSGRSVPCLRPRSAGSPRTAESLVAKVCTLVANTNQYNCDDDPVLFNHRPVRTHHASDEPRRFALALGSWVCLLLDTARSSRTATWVDERSVLAGCMDFLAELWRFLRTRKKFWLLPMILVFAIMGALLVITQSSALAPFIYTLF